MIRISLKIFFRILRPHPRQPIERKEKMKVRTLQIGAKLALAALAMLSFSSATSPAGSAQKPDDIQTLYAEILGDYEFYLDQKYIVTSIYQDQAKLWARVQGDSKDLELLPIDMTELRFKVNDPGKEQFAVFVRNSEGRVSAFRLITVNREDIGEKIPAGRTPHPQTVRDPLSPQPPTPIKIG